MKMIHLQREFEALVSDEDYAVLSAFVWRAKSNGRQRVYVARDVGLLDPVSGSVKRKTIYMHREIVNCPSHMVVDHIDGNGLNNQRSNLRITFHQNNSYNKDTRGVSGYKGVSIEKGRFRARIVMPSGERINLGQFKTSDEAAHAYDLAAIMYHGEFAWTNYPRENYGLQTFASSDDDDIPFA